jgi:hypothetical protein
MGVPGRVIYNVTQWRFYGGANRAIAPPTLDLAPPKNVRANWAKNGIMVTTIQVTYSVVQKCYGCLKKLQSNRSKDCRYLIGF